ncbi:MAG: FtsW/RodA/SpoVE family cell cycle protein [Corynebacterium sp.]|nr:FtsW/RodA/SpoVE family cell cycle protein [Corynebacterium sp.]
MSVMERLKARRREAILLLVAAIFVAVTLVNLEMSANTGFDLHLGQVMIGFVVVCLIAHLALCWLVPLADQIILPVVAGLNGLGLIMIYRLDLDNNSNMASRQVMWSLIGVVLMILTLVVIKDHRSLSKYSYILGLLGLILLALPMVWPIKVDADANIWISIGSFSIQPSEFSKILLLLFFAQLLVTKRALFTVAGYRFLGMEFPRLRDLGPVLAVWFVALVIMAGENDFGPALLLFGTVLGMIYLTTGRASWLLIGVVLVAIGGTGVYQVSSKIQARVENFIDPISNYHGSGYQLSQALFGMSWGGITGTGLGQGYPYTVPVAHSDFILAAIGEELGLIGLSGVLILFAIFIQRGMRTALITKDSYGKLVASGLSLTMAIQIFVVVGGISALMPMSGLTTPFMSQGGSSLMANYILVGIILRISNTAHKEMVA